MTKRNHAADQRTGHGHGIGQIKELCYFRTGLTGAAADFHHHAFGFGNGINGAGIRIVIPGSAHGRRRVSRKRL
jgi:hypothetical protein